jgi:GAF domain-containing protein
LETAVAARPDLTAALNDAARDIHSAQDLASTLDATVHAAKRSLPGVDHVGISVLHRGAGRIETKAGTDQLVWTLDEIQYDLGEGPCLSAVLEEPVVVVNELRHDQRWPRFVPAAVQHGLKAQLGLRLYTEGETLGGLNLYATASEVIDPEVQHTAELFAVHAALALGHIRREEQLHTALSTRKVIGQAIGIIMERYQLDEDRAFGYLVRVSRHSNVKLRDIAQEVVDRGNERATPSD